MHFQKQSETMKIIFNRYETEKLTERIPHPVGINARIQEKISAILNSVSATAAATPASASRKVMP